MIEIKTLQCLTQMLVMLTHGHQWRVSTDEGSECDNTLNLDVVLPGHRGHPRGHRCRGVGGGVACARDL